MALNLALSHQLDQLTGAQKAAILCMVLGSESASLITQKLGQEEVEQISFEIARMDRVSTEATERGLGAGRVGRGRDEAGEAVVLEGLEGMMAAGSIAAGGLDFAKEVLEKAFGTQ